MHASTRGTLGVTGVLASAMILLVVAPRQRVGGRHRRPGAQVQQPGQREGRSRLMRDTEGRSLRSGVAMRIIAGGVLQFRCRPEVNAMQTTPAVRCSTTRVSETWAVVKSVVRRGVMRRNA